MRPRRDCSGERLLREAMETGSASQSANVVTSEAELRRIYPQPVDLIKRKILSRLDGHCRRFISLSPLVFVSTASRDGRCDVSPRGDPAGFVEVFSDTQLVLPDRPGNNRLDGLRNIIENPRIGLLFVIPGVQDTLRVNGRAMVVTTPHVLVRMAVDGRLPASAIVVDIEEAFLHCGRAFKRGDVWDPTRYLAPGTLPPLGKMLADQTRPDAAENTLLADSERAPLY